MEEKITVEQAAEHLRLALPLMARQRVAVTPDNYAVWYEYVAGTHPGLRLAVDEILGQGGGFDEHVMALLYQRFLSPWDEERATATREALSKVVAGVEGSVQAADGGASRYQSALAGYAQQITADIGIGELREVVEKLADETDAMRANGATLRENLERSQREIEMLREELERARHEATNDTLTGLRNRKGLDESFAALALDGPMASLLMVDIDRFKRINDDCGHLVGDQVLKHVARTIRATIKGRDVAARFGGEEFVVMLPETPLAGALTLAEELRTMIARTRLVQSRNKRPVGEVTVSIGDAMQRPGESPDALIARADAAMYRAKREGRNRVVGEALCAATGTGG